MSIEGPLLHDGSQCIAYANFYNPAVPLLGAGGSGQFLAVAFQGGAGGPLLRQLQIANSSTSGPIYGVLQNTPLATEACDVGIMGLTKAVAGATITFGNELMVDANGRFITWVAAAGNYKVGLALDSATVNQVFTMLIYNPNVRFATL